MVSVHSSLKVLFSATLVRGHIAKFHIPYLERFKRLGWETWVAARNDYPGGTCDVPFCDHFVDVPFTRSSFSADNLRAYRMLKDLLERERFDLVHTHTPVGSVLTRLAARGVRREGATKLAYTAHGFHFYQGAPVVNWALWYPVERVTAHMTDLLITINREDYARARAFAPRDCQVEYVPGVGIDLAPFERARADVALRERKRAELGCASGEFLVLSVGDLIHRKHQEAVIGALPLMAEAGFDNVRLAICGSGPLEEKLRAQAAELGVSDRVSLLGFRNDIAELLAAADALAFPSFQEGLPVAVMEAMAAGTPVVASRIRGIDPDLIEDGRNGLLLETNDAAGVSHALERLIENPDLASRLGAQAHCDARRFAVEGVVDEVFALYRDALGVEGL